MMITQWLAFSFSQSELLAISIALQINHVCLQELVESMLAIRASDAALSPPRMEPLHGFKVLAIDVGLAKSDLLACAQSNVEIPSVNGRGQPIIGVVCIS